MNPVPPLTMILIKFRLSGRAQQADSLLRAFATAKYEFYSLLVDSLLLRIMRQ
jgi:hypothetical protein